MNRGPVMYLAMRSAPAGSIMFTDLINWKGTAERFNYWQLAQFKAIVAVKEIEVRFAAREDRPEQYFACHRAAIAAVRAELKRREDAELVKVRRQKKRKY